MLKGAVFSFLVFPHLLLLPLMLINLGGSTLRLRSRGNKMRPCPVQHSSAPFTIQSTRCCQEEEAPLQSRAWLTPAQLARLTGEQVSF